MTNTEKSAMLLGATGIGIAALGLYCLISGKTLRLCSKKGAKLYVIHGGKVTPKVGSRLS